MWKYQYDDAYVVAYEDDVFFRYEFLDYEEEEALSRIIRGNQ